MFLQNLKSVALPVPEVIGGTRKIWAAPGYAHTPFSPKYLWAFIRIGPVNVLAKKIWTDPACAHATFSQKF